MEDHAVDISCAVHELDVHLSADQTGQELLLEDPVHVALTLEKLLSGLCLKGKIRNTALKNYSNITLTTRKYYNSTHLSKTVLLEKRVYSVLGAVNLCCQHILQCINLQLHLFQGWMGDGAPSCI